VIFTEKVGNVIAVGGVARIASTIAAMSNSDSGKQMKSKISGLGDAGFA
jgi:hypothetical protein